jgi:uncharacterized protein YdeI (YjbR/CyaY-like superfamily)
MAAKDPRIDAYIEKAAPFARPILRKIRATVHAACPGVQEDLKWRHPAFVHHGILCGMAAFKQHCTFGFWKSALIKDGAGRPASAAMEEMGCLASVSDLPSKSVLTGYVRQAMALNESGAKVPKAPRKARPPATVPADLRRALKGNKRAAAAFEDFSPSHQREYVEWITEAKQAETRERRLATAVEWIAAGKPRHWKYMKR